MKRILILLLAAAMILCGTASCSDAPGEDGGTTVSPEAGADASGGAEEAEPEPDPYAYAREKFDAVAEADFDGADFGITSQAATGNSEKEIWVEELTGDVVNDAVYNRNLSVNSRFNCNITLTPGDVNSIIRQAVTSGDSSYKLAFPNMATAASIAQQGCLMDYMKLDGLNLTDAWWDQGTLAMQIVG